ncbi:MAG TPA: M24 family metallopeptidase [Candidatus Binataceae bacterium]|nr:M24 family metallopeptidase [Candidatus Binataceae bacterium]
MTKQPMGRLDEIAAALAEASLDGWLFYDFRHSDPLAYRVLGLPSGGITTRRWFCYVPATGMPRALVSAVEAERLAALGVETTIYRSADEMAAALGAILAGARRVAMDYSPQCAIPYVARVDAGTVELVSSLGVEVVSAADLIQRFEARLTAAQLASHRRAAAVVRRVVEETFAEIARRLRSAEPVSEYTAQQFVLARFAALGVVADDPPIVALNANAALPHFAPSAARDTPVRHGDLVLLDLWAKEPGEESIYADLTWMAYAGERVPEEQARVFAIVAEARDAAVDFICKRVHTGAPVRGEEADRVARGVIERAGFAAHFLHRTGHSIGREVHGAGANLDSLETRDHRTLIDRTCFSVEPGIYLPGRFGVRSELNMTIENGRAEVSAAPAQRQIAALLA